MTISTKRYAATFLAHRASLDGLCVMCRERLVHPYFACEYSRYFWQKIGLNDGYQTKRTSR